jgi:dolichol kinase
VPIRYILAALGMIAAALVALLAVLLLRPDLAMTGLHVVPWLAAAAAVVGIAAGVERAR